MTSISHGLKWNGIGQIVSQLSAIIGSIILARLLTPNDFGTIGMVTVISGFAYMFLDIGFTSALIQKKEITEIQLQTVFWIYIFVSIILFIGLLISAPFIARFYEKEILVLVCNTISVLFLIGAIPQIPKILFTRSLNFKILSIAKIISIPCSYILAITVAYFGGGLWSIAIQIISAPTLETIVILSGTNWRPKLRFEIKSISELLNFSFSYFIYGLTEYWAKNIDGLLLGKYFGANPMGIYTRSFALVLLPVRNITQAINSTIFPHYSKLQNQIEDFQELYLKSNRMQAFVVFPCMAGLVVLSEPLITVLLGNQWDDMIFPVKLFAFVGLAQTLNSLMDTGIFSLGYAKRLMYFGFFEKSVIIIGTIIGLRYGLIGVVWARLVTSLLTLIPKTIIFSNISQIPVSRIYTLLSKVFTSTIIMIILIIASQRLLSEDTALIKLTIGVITGLTSYFTAAHTLKEPMLLKLTLMIKQSLRI